MKSTVALLLLGTTLLTGIGFSNRVSATPRTFQPVSNIKAVSPSINGSWKGMIGFSDGINLKVTINGKTGTYETNYQGQYTQQGTINVSQNGNQVVLTLQNYGNQGGVVVLNGMTNSNKMDGTFQMGQHSGPFGLKRV